MVSFRRVPLRSALAGSARGFTTPPEWIAAVDTAQRIARGALLRRRCRKAARVKEIGFVSARVIELPEKCPL